VLVRPHRRRFGRDLAVKGHLVAGTAGGEVGAQGGVVGGGTVAAGCQQQQQQQR
jgi:hypothetical protein